MAWSTGRGAAMANPSATSTASDSRRRDGIGGGRVAWCSPRDRGRRDAVVRAGARRGARSSQCSATLAVVLVHGLDWSYQEAADVLGVPVSSVRNGRRPTRCSASRRWCRPSSRRAGMGASFGASSAAISWNSTFEGFDARLGLWSSKYDWSNVLVTAIGDLLRRQVRLDRGEAGEHRVLLDPVPRPHDPDAEVVGLGLGEALGRARGITVAEAQQVGVGHGVVALLRQELAAADGDRRS